MLWFGLMLYLSLGYVDAGQAREPSDWKIARSWILTDRGGNAWATVYLLPSLPPLPQEINLGAALFQ